MSTTTLAAPIRVNTAGVHARPGLGRLVAVELRKMVDTRAGFWLQAAMVALTALVVVVRLLVGDAAHHTLQSVLDVGLQPAAVLLPVLGILLVTSEWSQRTGLITFALVPVRSPSSAPAHREPPARRRDAGDVRRRRRRLGARRVARRRRDLVRRRAADGPVGRLPTTGMVIGVALGAILLTSAPAIVLLFALPMSWMAVVSLPLFSGVAPWWTTRAPSAR